MEKKEGRAAGTQGYRATPESTKMRGKRGEKKKKKGGEIFSAINTSFTCIAHLTSLDFKS